MRKYDRATLIDYLLKIAIVLGASLCLFVLAAYLFPLAGRFFTTLVLVILPFILAWLVAILTQPMVDFFNHTLRMPRSLAVLLMMLFFMGLIAGVLALVIARVIIEATKIAENFPTIRLFIETTFQHLQELFYRLNLQPDDLAIIKEWLMNRSEQIISIASSAAGGAMQIIYATPMVLLFLIVTLVAIFFWCRDRQMVENVLVKLAPRRYKSKVEKVYRTLSNVVGNYCRAQLTLISVSTLVCIVAYSVLGVEGAFTIGLLTGIFDILPVLGPGTIIIPWGIISLITGNYFLGIGLLIMYVLLIIFRNILEPKLVGDRLNLHPLATLASIFIGMGLLGLWGLFIGPISLAMGYAIWKSIRTTEDV